MQPLGASGAPELGALPANAAGGGPRLGRLNFSAVKHACGRFYRRGAWLGRASQGVNARHITLLRSRSSQHAREVTWVAQFTAHLQREPEPLESIAPQPIPAELSKVVARCMAKDPAERYPSTRALLDALAPCIVAGPLD